MTDHDDFTAIFEFLDEPKAIGALNDIFSGLESFPTTIETLGDWLQETRNGLPRCAFDSLFNSISEQCSFPLEHLTITKSILDGDEACNGRSSIVETLFAVRLATYYILLVELLENPDQAAQFLVSRHPELNRMTPVEAALTTNGGKKVLAILARGLHGLPA